MQLLVLSNGHGEDVIAVRIIEQLQRHLNVTKLVALPLVGEGNAYRQKNIPILGRVQQMPSGGFIYMDSSQLWQDLRRGLVKLTLEQLQTVRQWGKNGGSILAVGDIVPLLFAWLSGANYAFVGTAKSEYYLRDEQGWLPQTSWLERWFGSVYLPWDRWLMSRSRCQAVFPRDSLTTEVLLRWSIPAYDLGNPMMDGLGERIREDGVTQRDGDVEKTEKQKSKENIERLELNSAQKQLKVLLLPGSRMPEAERNWQQILAAVKDVIATFQAHSIIFWAAIAPALPLEPFKESLVTQGWSSASTEIEQLGNDPKATAFIQQQATLILSQNAYEECLQQADVAIAMAGTAIEQFVGLGKPVITMPGKGPQFTYAFAEAQTRLLGCSVTLVSNSQQVAEAIRAIINNPQKREQIALNGLRRMGTPGAAARIADCLLKRFS